eukprot:gene3209-4055_t
MTPVVAAQAVQLAHIVAADCNVQQERRKYIMQPVALQVQQKALPKTVRRTDRARAVLLSKTWEQLAYLSKLYEPYTFYAAQFETTNTQKLFESLSEEDKQKFNFDLEAFDWTQYLMDVHVPGLKKYVLKGRSS